MLLGVAVRSPASLINLVAVLPCMIYSQSPLVISILLRTSHASSHSTTSPISQSRSVTLRPSQASSAVPYGREQNCNTSRTAPLNARLRCHARVCAVRKPLHNDTVDIIEIGAGDEDRFVGADRVARIEHGRCCNASACKPHKTKQRQERADEKLLRGMARSGPLRLGGRNVIERKRRG
jgi:hypothetical protein